MSRQHMTFELSYGTAKQTSKCKSCQGQIADDNLVIGVKSDSMYDPMWYHFQCFWTRCWYRKQMTRHLEDYTELAGYSKLSAEDRQKFKDALQELAGVPGEGQGLKRRSVSEDNLVDALDSKRSKPDVVTDLPKLSLSATGFLSRSKENLLDASSQQPRPAYKAVHREEEIVVSETLAVSVRKTSEGAALVISTKDAASNRSKVFTMSQQQWRKLVDVLDDVTRAIRSRTDQEERDQEFPLLDSQTIRVSAGDQGALIQLTNAKDTTPSAEGQAKDVTFTSDQWLTLTKRAGEIGDALLRLSR